MIGAENLPEYLPVHRLLKGFCKNLSPVEVLKAQIAQIEKCGQRINVLTCRHFEQAMKAASESEAPFPCLEAGQVR